MVHISKDQNETEKATRKMIRLSGSGLRCSIQMTGILERWMALMKALSFTSHREWRRCPQHPWGYDFLKKPIGRVNLRIPKWTWNSACLTLSYLSNT